MSSTANSSSVDETNNEESFLNQITSLKEEDYIRGATIDNVEEKCLHLCQSYVGGTWWAAKDINDIEVTRITGGLTNQLYKVQLKSCVKHVENVIYQNEPTVLAIKFYLEKLLGDLKKEDERLTDTIVLTILSETNIGPKVYGIFANGFISDFVEVNLLQNIHIKFLLNLLFFTGLTF